MSDERLPIIAIHPEPTPEELAAIVAAITAALNGHRAANRVSALNYPRASRWARAGRLEAMRSPLEWGKRGIQT